MVRLDDGTGHRALARLRRKRAVEAHALFRQASIQFIAVKTRRVLDERLSPEQRYRSVDQRDHDKTPLFSDDDEAMNVSLFRFQL